MSNDTLSEILTCIRNALRLKSYGVEVRKTKITKILSRILLKEGWILSIRTTDPIIPYIASDSRKILDVRTTRPRSSLFIRLKYLGTHQIPMITNLRSISRPSRRVYVKRNKIPKILGGLGLAIISTSRGVLSDRVARRFGVGGEVLCSIWLI